jgi:tRNA A-37 threonylcarbamoyl transferase component Bud32
VTPTTTMLRPGDVLGGFRVEDVIGIGGMAIVYRAVQESLGRPVALKVLSSKLSRDTVFRERFRREGTHAASLEHPNIVPVYDSGEIDGHLYLAMRLVEGTNLAELIQTRGLTADQTIEILRPIASALDTAHAAGLIHRDVKPQNILITAQGHPYLADFGVAKGSNTYGLTATGGFVGSVNYASPEQIKGLTLTAASDVYALTAVLYQCLTGQVPYPRETDAGVMHAQLNEPPPTLPEIGRADSNFPTVLARGMAKDPGARYGHAGDLINAAALSVSSMSAALRKVVPAFPAVAADAAPAAGNEEAQTAEKEEAQARQATSEEGLGADLTAVDQRRGPAPAAEPEPEEAQRRRWPIAAGIGLAVALVAGVVLLASLGSGGKATVKRAAATHAVARASRPSPRRPSRRSSRSRPRHVVRSARRHRRHRRSRHASSTVASAPATSAASPPVRPLAPVPAPAPSAPASSPPAASAPAPSPAPQAHGKESSETVISAPK